MARNRGRQGCSEICVNLLGMDIVIEFDYEITCDAIPQSYDEPASGMEYEVTYTGVYRDEAGWSKNQPKQYLDVPPWLETVFQEYLENSDRTYDEIVSDLED